MAPKYEVGYRKPPKSRQFVKGKSGNPKGRPKGSRSLKSDLTDELYGKISITESGQRRSLTKQQAIVKRLTIDALSGDAKARTLILQMMLQLERAGELETELMPTSLEDQKILARYVKSITGTQKRGKTK